MGENIYDHEFVSDDIASGLHRSSVGGMWDELGKKQFEYLMQQGLRPSHQFLDIGCGCLRGGIHFIRYLDVDRYYGCDINTSLMDAGYDVELSREGLKDKLARNHLLADDAFRVGSFGQSFQYALAFSVFTHLTFNSIKRCLIEVSKVMDKESRFYATFFIVPTQCLIHPYKQSEEITSFMDKDPYHYELEDIKWLGDKCGFNVEIDDNFIHPRNQKMVMFTRK